MESQWRGNRTKQQTGERKQGLTGCYKSVLHHDPGEETLWRGNGKREQRRKRKQGLTDRHVGWTTGTQAT